MHIPTQSLLALFQACLALAAVVEKLDSPPAGWIKDDVLSSEMNKGEMSMKLRIHLVHQDMDKFHDLATKVRPWVHY